MITEKAHQGFRKSLGMLLCILSLSIIVLFVVLIVNYKFGKFVSTLAFVFLFALLFKPFYDFFARKFGYETIAQYFKKK